MFIKAFFTVLMGRRRTGKTTLMMHALEGETYLYFFIGKKSEQIASMTNLPIEEIQAL